MSFDCDGILVGGNVPFVTDVIISARADHNIWDDTDPENQVNNIGPYE